MRDTLTTFLIVSIAYIISYSLTSGFVYPIQTTLLPNVSEKTGLLFLPHGVRIIAMYYLGWRAMFHLLPASYLMWFLSVYGNGPDLDVYQPIVSLVACYVGVKIAELLIVIRPHVLDLAAWKFLIISGVFGSVFNGIGLTALQHEAQFHWNVLGYVIGDVAGLFASLFLLLYLFKFLRHYKDI
jgi:hypothetical protein